MNYYTGFDSTLSYKRVVFAWPRGQSPHQADRFTNIRGPRSTHEAATAALQKEVDTTS